MNTFRAAIGVWLIACGCVTIAAAQDAQLITRAQWMLYAVARDSIVNFKRLPEWIAYVRRRGH